MRRSQASAEPEERPKRERPKAPAKGKAVERESLAKIPHDPVNEQVLIAAAAVDPETRRKLLAVVPPESFFAKGHPEAWRVFGELEARGLTYDPATVKQLSGDEVDTDYLDQLIEARPVVPPNLAHHVECLRWDRSRVEAARGPIAALLELLREPSSDPDDVRAKARSVSDAFSMGGSLLVDGAALARDQAKARAARKLGRAFYPFGGDQIQGLDFYDTGPKAGKPRFIPGAAPRGVSCVTGLSGSGKSTVVGRVVLAQLDAGRRVLWGAWEEGSGDSLEQIAVMNLGLSREANLTGTLSPEDDRLVDEEMERLVGRGLRFFALPKYQRGKSKKEAALNDRSLDLIHEHVVTSGCDFFVADLWRRVVRQFDPEEEEVALYRQQDIAQQTGVHCMLVHQQRLKDIESRQGGDKRPTREGLKGSGTWVEVPDTIMGVHRPALWKNVDDDTLEILVLKQRKGKWPLAVEFDMEPDAATLTNGRSVEFKREQALHGGVDEFLQEEARAERGAKRGKR